MVDNGHYMRYQPQAAGGANEPMRSLLAPRIKHTKKKAQRKLRQLFSLTELDKQTIARHYNIYIL